MKNIIRILFLLVLLFTNYVLFAQASTTTETIETQILRIEFRVSNGASRSFVIGFAEGTTDEFDYGYDGGLITDPPADDMGSLLNGQQYVLQAFAPITPDKEIDLVLHASGNFNYTLISTEISNFPKDQDLYLKDNLTGEYFNLREETGYQFTSKAGTFMERFQVTFREPVLSNYEFTAEKPVIYINQLEDKLYGRNIFNNSNEISFINMLGQVMKTYNSLSSQALENGINISDLNSGIYIINVKTDEKIINKKVLIN